ncbi:acetyltransferas-like protein [Westerdykella ornata]|uniref:Acetyltransferas-like protein n=1 Tax=Westerdykella ornata TaxID=318751 RepID=A0A6A6JPA3_WESOR|nr:acetyltransferas-like protein [Westerdykella ornata]KAF2278075.1 acetyltransferas-like protein [Westerdykella ornata]
MPLRLTHVTDRADFEPVMACEWLSYENPMQPFFRLFCPVYETGREDSITKAASLQWAWHEHEPDAHWLKVVDDEAPATAAAEDRIAGAAWYKIYKEDPFQHEEDEVADWYPEDSTRDFVTQAIGQMEEPRRKGARKPHVFLNIIFTHPSYRGQGVGAMLLRWGMDKADELDVEFWLDATPMGKPFYEKYGFELVQKNPLVPKTETPDDKWRKLEAEIGEIIFWTMKRRRKSERTENVEHA